MDWLGEGGGHVKRPNRAVRSGNRARTIAIEAWAANCRERLEMFSNLKYIYIYLNNFLMANLILNNIPIKIFVALN